MKTGWAQYQADVDGQICSICVDLDMKSEAPDVDLGICYVVRVALLAPSPQGMAEPEEEPALEEIERELDDSMTRLAGAVPVGHSTGGSVRDYFFYGPMAELLESVVNEVCGAFPHYEIVAGADPDPDWLQYRETLCPAEPAAEPAAEPEPTPSADARVLETVELAPEEIRAEMQKEAPQHPSLIKVRAKLEQLRAAGDDPTRERPVSHWLAFGDEELRATFLLQVNHGEFEHETLETKDDGRLKMWARLERPQSTEIRAIEATVLRLIHLAAEHGGDYDAIETVAVKPKA